MTGNRHTNRARELWSAHEESATSPIRIVLADDYALARTGLVYALHSRNDLQVVGQASSGEEALRLVEELRPDVVLMDLLMPGMGGLAAIKELHERFPQLPVLALSSFQEGKLVEQALAAGATSYLLKDVELEGLAKVVRLAYRGMPTLATAAAHTLVNEIARRPPAVGHDLTGREREVLALFATGLSYQQIADRLMVSSSTVKHHGRSIRSKLGTNSRTETVVVALRNQLVTSQL